MNRYRNKKIEGVTEDEQEQIYETCRKYKVLPQAEQMRIKRLCGCYGAEFYDALFCIMTTDRTFVWVCQNHFVGRTTLWKAEKRFYITFKEQCL